MIGKVAAFAFGLCIAGLGFWTAYRLGVDRTKICMMRDISNRPEEYLRAIELIRSIKDKGKEDGAN